MTCGLGGCLEVEDGDEDGRCSDTLDAKSRIFPMT